MSGMSGHAVTSQNPMDFYSKSPKQRLNPTYLSSNSILGQGDVSYFIRKNDAVSFMNNQSHSRGTQGGNDLPDINQSRSIAHSRTNSSFLNRSVSKPNLESSRMVSPKGNGQTRLESRDQFLAKKKDVTLLDSSQISEPKLNSLNNARIYSSQKNLGISRATSKQSLANQRMQSRDVIQSRSVQMSPSGSRTNIADPYAERMATGERNQYEADAAVFFGNSSPVRSRQGNPNINQGLHAANDSSSLLARSGQANLQSQTMNMGNSPKRSFSPVMTNLMTNNYYGSNRAGRGMDPLPVDKFGKKVYNQANNSNSAFITGTVQGKFNFPKRSSQEIGEANRNNANVNVHNSFNYGRAGGYFMSGQRVDHFSPNFANEHRINTGSNMRYQQIKQELAALNGEN